MSARGKLAFGAGLSKLSEFGFGLSSQLQRRKEEKEKLAAGAALSGLQEEEAGLGIAIKKQTLAKGEREEEKRLKEEATVKRFQEDLTKPEIINNPVIRKAFQQAFGMVERKLTMPEPATQTERVPTQAEQLGRIEQDPVFSTSKIPEIEERREFLQKQLENLREEEIKVGVRKEGQEFKTSEREAGQEFRTSEREAGQDFSAEQQKIKDAADKLLDIDNPNFKTANFEVKLMNQVKKDTKVQSFDKINQQFSRVKATWDDYEAKLEGLKNGTLSKKDVNKTKIALDQILINTFNKILDPPSVVRESEFARTAASAAAIERVKGLAPKWAEGGVGLTDRDRTELVRATGILHDSSQKIYNETIDRYKQVFGGYSGIGVDPDRVLAPFLLTQETPAPTGRGLTQEEQSELDALEAEFGGSR